MPELLATLERIIVWTKLKCRIQKIAPQDVFFSEREIWWAHLGENVGSEQNGKNDQFERPVLILKKYHAGLLTILPISTTDKSSPYLVPLERISSGKQGKIILSQIRTISSKRLIRKQRMLPEHEFTAVRSRLLKML